ncbi:hypothetical protein NPIL_301741 [Nephila pilipes]|uniref:Uncharacterized protein n=1 Tax=Nephila pilipes TaxID=299642 RepID=A0A8X6TYI2_NEPPI|nr:hypothetical protein NPIL_301741 [Nephila pilipes]
MTALRVPDVTGPSLRRRANGNDAKKEGVADTPSEKLERSQPEVGENESATALKDILPASPPSRICRGRRRNKPGSSKEISPDPPPLWKFTVPFPLSHRCTSFV